MKNVKKETKRKTVLYGNAVINKPWKIYEWIFYKFVFDS